jgi:hypothetical protein
MQISKMVLPVVLIVALLLATGSAVAENILKPFILGSSGPGTIDNKLTGVKAALAKEGLEVVGEYAPYKGAHVIAITTEALKKVVAQSKFGAYGAVLRVSLTETEKGLQISYANPFYVAQAYRMNNDLSKVAAQLEKALGRKEVFGSKEGIVAKKLRKYHYMFSMPYFSDPVELAAYPSQDEALKVVEDNLEARKNTLLKVFRVDVPGKKESVFGVGISEGYGADAKVMEVIDKGPLKQTAHLPYELIVSDGKIYMLHGRFRIAVNFPDLGMGTFMKISGAPKGIEAQLRIVAGGELEQ